jgi:hypothetical protein
VGRNGMHRYNNQDHSMVTAVLAAENTLGASHDVWNVNVEEEYHEEKGQITDQAEGADRGTGRSAPVIAARLLGRKTPVADGEEGRLAHA